MSARLLDPFDVEHGDVEIGSMLDFAPGRPGSLGLGSSEVHEGQRAQASERLVRAGYRFLESFDLFSVICVQDDARN
jgi:hypothetical protein